MAEFMTGTGCLLLEGGAEFGGGMAEADLAALDRAGGTDSPIAILPTAAAPDHNAAHAGANGVRWFHSLGARQVDVVPVVDARSASDPSLAQRVGQARLIYMLGGFPRYLAETMHLSLVWQAALEAYANGAVLGGSSAGAMVLCEHYYDPESAEVCGGLGLLPACCILPHHNTFGRSWVKQLERRLPAAVLIGIDEQTGLLGQPAGTWSVHGTGEVVVYRKGQPHDFARGDTLRLDPA